MFASDSWRLQGAARCSSAWRLNQPMTQSLPRTALASHCEARPSQKSAVAPPVAMTVNQQPQLQQPQLHQQQQQHLPRLLETAVTF